MTVFWIPFYYSPQCRIWREDFSCDVPQSLKKRAQQDDLSRTTFKPASHENIFHKTTTPSVLASSQERPTKTNPRKSHSPLLATKNQQISGVVCLTSSCNVSRILHPLIPLSPQVLPTCHCPSQA